MTLWNGCYSELLFWYQYSLLLHYAILEKLVTLMWSLSVKRPTLGVECTYIFVSSNTYLRGINKRDVIELVCFHSKQWTYGTVNPQCREYVLFYMLCILTSVVHAFAWSKWYYLGRVIHVTDELWIPDFIALSQRSLFQFALSPFSLVLNFLNNFVWVIVVRSILSKT